MRKNSLAIAAVALFCSVLTLAGSSLAYLRSSTPAITNIITTGRVDITLTEEGWDNEQPRPISPGEQLDKQPVVTNTGTVACWVRLRVALGSDTVQLLRSGALELVGLNRKDFEWSGLPTRWSDVPAGKGVEMTAILKTALPVGGVSPPIFTAVALGNNYNGDGNPIRITVSAEAVQLIPKKTYQTCWEVF